MADGDERRSTRTRGNPVSYKEPGELKISQLEARRDTAKQDDDVNSDEDEVFEQRSTKKGGAQPKKRRVSGAGASVVPRSSAAKPARHSIDGSESLLEIISHKPSAIPMAVKQWWADYDKDPPSAVGKLTNMMLEACGLPERLPHGAFSDDDEKDVDEYILELVEKCTSKNDDLQGISGSLFDKKDQKGRKIQANFSDFWEKFVTFAPEAELRMLHEHPFCPWLHAMSTSSLKVLRQVSTTVGLDMMMAVVGKTNETLASMTNTERLYETACKKKDVRDMERFKEQLESKREIRKDAETCIHSFFNSIFIHRYKDAHHEVRAKCTEVVGKLIMEYSTKFLDNAFLKYIGWALYDKSTDVRLMALEAVDRFYNSQLVNNLEAFTTRFRSRIMQMSLDVDKEVQIRAIETARTMGVQGLLSDDEEGHGHRETIYKMISEEDQDIRASAASFIKSIYIDRDLDPEYQNLKKKDGKNAPNREMYMLKGVVELLNVVAVCDDMHFIMDPLMRECDFLDDLNMMCDVMMEEPVGVDKDAVDCLDDEQKATLAKMILGVMATLSEKADADESGHRMAKKKNPLVDKCKKATLVLGDKLAQMIRFFSSNNAVLIPLIRTLEHFMLSAFNAKDISIKDIADALIDVTKKAIDAELLEACALALEHFTSCSYAAKPTVEALIKNLFKTLTADLKKVSEAFTKRSKLSAVHTYSLRRMSILGGSCDIFKSEQSVRACAVDMLEVVSDEDSKLDPSSSCQALLLVSQYLAWSVANNSMDDRVNETKEQLVGCCKKLFEHSSLNAQLRVQANASLADCQHLFGRYLENIPKDLEMTKSDVEELLTSVDGTLSGRIDVSGVTEMMTINRAFAESEDDPHGSMRAAAINLFKIVAYGDMDWRKTEEEFVCDMLSSLTLHRPYPARFHTELLKMLQESLDGMENPGDFWKSAHTHMCTRIAQEIHHRTNKKVTDEMFAALVESCGNLRFRDQEDLKIYVAGGIEWVLEEWQTTRAAFTDAIAVQVKRLDRQQVSEILVTFDEICHANDVPIETPIDDAVGNLPVLLKFRQFLRDKSSSNMNPGPGRPRGNATPAARAKARLAFTPSLTPGSSQASSRGSSARAGSSVKRKVRQLGSDDEDEDGWVAATPSRGSSGASSSDGKRRR